MPKAYAIVGWTIDGALYCVRCCPQPVVETRSADDDTEDKARPVFACEATIDDVCDDCLIPLEDA
jgi:hypothetical protein